jgi:hypothetical protein
MRGTTSIHGAESPKRSRILELPRRWQNYVLAVFLSMLLPLLPLGVELWLTGDISSSAMTLAVSMHAISLGVASRDMCLFGWAVIVSIFFAVAYGMVTVQNTLLPYTNTVASVAMLVVFIWHAIDRYNQHVVGCKSFLPFMDK